MNGVSTGCTLLLAASLASGIVGCGERDDATQVETHGKSKLGSVEPGFAPTAPPTEEGGVSAREVVDRARRAWADGDFREVYYCIERDTREGWLRSMTLSSMFATIGYEQKTDPEERAAVGALAQVMVRHGATLTLAERIGGLDAEQMTDALLDGVDDPGGLFGGIVGWAESEGHATDPMAALDRGSTMMVRTEKSAGGIPIPSEAELANAERVTVNGPPGMTRTLGRIGAKGDVRKVEAMTATLGRKKPDGSEETWTLEVVETSGRWHITDG